MGVSAFVYPIHERFRKIQKNERRMKVDFKVSSWDGHYIISLGIICPRQYNNLINYFITYYFMSLLIGINPVPILASVLYL